MLSAYVLRLGSGMVVFVLLARWLGPEAFGVFSFWLALATLLALPVNFGFGSKILRDFGTRPERAQTTMGEVLSARYVLASVVALIAICALPFIKSDTERVVFLLLFFAQLFESFSEHHTLGFRVKAHFSKEAATASLVSTWHIILMTIVAAVFPSLLAISIAFAISRLSGMLITAIRSSASIGPVIRAPWRTVIDTLRSTWAYALELGLLTTYGQLDTLIINGMLGASAVGLYQSGMKLVQGAGRVAPVLAQVLLPSLASATSDSRKFKSMCFRTLVVFVGVGGLGCLFLTVFASQITNVLFGIRYAELTPLLPMFGVLLLIKFTETGMGLILVARGQQAQKVWFVAGQLLFLLVSGTAALGKYGLPGWQWASALATMLLLCTYGWLLTRKAD